MTSTRPPRPARLALTGVKLAVAVTIIALGSVGGPPVPREYVGQHAAEHLAEHLDEHLDGRASRLLAVHGCSPTGFSTDQQPRSALIRSASGRLRHVDFDTGWRIYTARGAAELLAVCLEEPPR